MIPNINNFLNITSYFLLLKAYRQIKLAETSDGQREFACCLSSVLIKLFTFLRLWCQQFMTEACKMVKHPQTAKWYDGSSTDCLPAFPFTATTPDTHACTHTNTHALYHEPTCFNQVQQQDGNLTLSNLQLNLTPALTLLRHSRPAVDEQNETGGATATKKRFNFGHTEVQFHHALESDN